MSYFKAYAMIHQCWARFPIWWMGGHWSNWGHTLRVLACYDTGPGRWHGKRAGGASARRTPTLALALGCGWRGGKYGAPSTSLGLNFAICKMRGLNNWAKWLSNLPVHHNWGNLVKIEFPRTYFLRFWLSRWGPRICSWTSHSSDPGANGPHSEKQLSQTRPPLTT